MGLGPNKKLSTSSKYGKSKLHYSNVKILAILPIRGFEFD
jgi:hypothetical protein